MAEIRFIREYKWHGQEVWYDAVYESGRLYQYMEQDLPKTLRKWLDGKTGRKQYDKYHGEEIIYTESKVVKWLAVNDDDMIRAICDKKDEAIWEAECERINDIQQGFTPDEYRFVKAEFIGESDNMWANDIYPNENWREV